MSEIAEHLPDVSHYPVNPDESLPACFARVVASYGLRTALVSSHGDLSYRELNAAANRLAHELLRRGGVPGDRVAILTQRDSHLIVAILSVLKIARVVVVLNASDPQVRLRLLIEDADPSLILTDEECQDLASQIAGAGCAIVCSEDCTASASAHDLDFEIDPETTAFLVYTSGSTGRPKGVMQTHRQIVHNTIKHSDSMTLGAGDRIALLASLSGSQAVGTTWSALLCGAALCHFPTIEKGVTGMARWMVDRGITVYISSASLFRHFMQTLDDTASFPQVRVVRIASETATSSDFNAFRRHFPKHSVFVHTLSSSETGNIAQHRWSGSDTVADGRLPVGRPAKGMEILLLDEHNRDVGPGEIGEIVVRSRYLCAGYWRNEALTSERFSECGDGVRMFRGGDLGRINSDGLLEFIGRRDSRIKIRGFRVEISEVEAAVLRLPDVERVAVCALDRPTGDSELVAFVIIGNPSSSSPRSLRHALRPLLPDHMIPSRFVLVDRFPLTPHGKIDRDKLLQNVRSRGEQTPEDQPQTATERLLADVWAEVFNSSDFGRHDDFFELGGDSLRAAVVAARIHDALGVDLNLGVFADHPTLADLARTIEAMRLPEIEATASPLIPASTDRSLPLSMSQERIWKFCQTPQAAKSDGFVRHHRILGPLDVEVLRECMNDMDRRHEILRTTIALVDGRPRQIVHPPAPVALPLIDCSGMPDAELHCMRAFENEAGRTFDLTQGPLYRFLLARIREGEHWLLRAYHPIIADGWSWKLYFEEVARLYEARVNGEPPPLNEFASLQYGAYAAWQRRTFHPESAAYREEVDWWKDFLAHAPSLTLPFKRQQPPASLDPGEGFVRWQLDPDIAQRLDELARQDGVSYFSLRLAAFVALLAAETGEPDVVIGTYMTNRNRRATQNMLGHVTNLVTLRFRCDLNSTFREWLALVRKRMIEIAAHAELPYEELRKELSTRKALPPDIRVIFNMTADHATEYFAGLKMNVMEGTVNNMPWGFSITLDERSDHAGFSVAFDAAMYDPSGVRAFINRLSHLLDDISRNPELRIDESLAKAGRTTQFPNASLQQRSVLSRMFRTFGLD
jgi:amino acid adenylation domain-containing protein